MTTGKATKTRGVVSGGCELTARAGIEMLERGGNAFDAAVAATAATFLTESCLTSPAGGGFMMAHTAEGKTVLYDFFTNVPGLGPATPATPATKVKGDAGKVNFHSVDIHFADTVQQLFIGEGSAAVPGTPAGLEAIYRNHCTLPIDVLLGPAIEYARSGFELDPYQAHFIEILSPMLLLTQEGREIYAPGGRLARGGELMRNEPMARTLEMLATDGFKAFYSGEIAERILKGFGSPGGLMTREDLEAYASVARDPLHIDYRGHVIYTNPVPSLGGSLIAFALKLLEGFDLGSMERSSPEYFRLLSGAMRITDSARSDGFDENVSDSGFVEGFLSEANVGPYRERLSTMVGRGGKGGKGGKGAGEALAETLTPGRGPGNTTHISVIDELGNSASITTSLGIGCGSMIPGTGIMMNNMLGEEDLNLGGFHLQRPGDRMSSMMAPTAVMKDNAPEIALGSGGSKRIRNAILQVLINLIDFRMDAKLAVDSARVHWDGAFLQVEPGPGPKSGEGSPCNLNGKDGLDADTTRHLGSALLGALKDSGVRFNVWKGPHMYFGGVHTAVRGGGGVFSGAGDPRRAGVALECD